MDICINDIMLSKDLIVYNKSLVIQKVIKRSESPRFIVLITPVIKFECPLILEHKSFQTD